MYMCLVHSILTFYRIYVYLVIGVFADKNLHKPTRCPYRDVFGQFNSYVLPGCNPLSHQLHTAYKHQDKLNMQNCRPTGPSLVNMIY